jgi:hypothetical protein
MHMRESMESSSASSLSLLLQRDIYSVSFLAMMLFNYCIRTTKLHSSMGTDVQRSGLTFSIKYRDSPMMIFCAH